MILAELQVPAVAVIFFATIFQAAPSNALYVRDSGGVWRSLSWGKRSNQGGALTIPLTNHNDQSYSMPLRMGTPFQEITMAISLSHPYITVASPGTPGQPGYYDPASSQTFLGVNATAFIPDLAGKLVQYNFSVETCGIQDFTSKLTSKSTALTSQLQPLEPHYYQQSYHHLSNVETNLYPDCCHGVVGYGMQPGDNIKPTFNVLSRDTLLGVYFGLGTAPTECGMELNRAADGVGGGVLTMGGRDSTAYSGDFTSMQAPPINASTSIDYKSWSIPLDKVFAGIADSVDSIVPGQVIVSIDPNYPTITLPASAVKLLYSRIRKATVWRTNPNRYTIPCDTTIQIKMTFGGKNFTMDPRDAIIKEGDTCFGTIEVGDGDIFRVGSPFLRNVYTTFGATLSERNASLTVAFADKLQRTGNGTHSGGAKPTNAATITVPNNDTLIFFLLLVVASISMGIT